MRFTVNKDQRMLVYRKGDYVRALKPGRYNRLSFTGCALESYDVNERFEPPRNLNLYLGDEALAAELEVVEVKDNRGAIHYADGLFKEVLSAGRYAFWKTLVSHEFIEIDFSTPQIPDSLSVATLSHRAMAPCVQVCEIASTETGLLFYNGSYQKSLSAGKYYFWNGPVKVSVEKVDLRQQQLDIGGQEILTHDNITLRVNFVLQYKVRDPYRVAISLKNGENQLYNITQLIIREYVGAMTLEAVLSNKDELAGSVLTRLKEQGEPLGYEFHFAGVKDIILPGEMRAILSQVIEAQKRAEANLITRREETASTRSLLNTAKLMENNPVLLRLKELEYIESVASKVEKLSITGSSPLIEQLGRLFEAQTPRGDSGSG